MKKYMMDPDKPFEMLRYQIMEDLRTYRVINVLIKKYDDAKHILTQLIRYCGEVENIDIADCFDGEYIIINIRIEKDENGTHINCFPNSLSDCCSDWIDGDKIYIMEDCPCVECANNLESDVYVCVFKNEKYEHLVADEEGRPKSFYQSWEDKYGTHTRYYASTNPKFVNEMYREWKFKEGD